MTMLFGSPLTLAPYIVIVVTGCMFQFVGPVLLCFSKLSKLLVWGLGLGVSVSVTVKVGFAFYIYYVSAKLTAFSSCCTVMLQVVE